MLRTLGLVRVDTSVGLLEVIRINWVLKVRLLGLRVSGRARAVETASCYQQETRKKTDQQTAYSHSASSP